MAKVSSKSRKGHSEFEHHQFLFQGDHLTIQFAIDRSARPGDHNVFLDRVFQQVRGCHRIATKQVFDPAPVGRATLPAMSYSWVWIDVDFVRGVYDPCALRVTQTADGKEHVTGIALVISSRTIKLVDTKVLEDGSCLPSIPPNAMGRYSIPDPCRGRCTPQNRTIDDNAFRLATPCIRGNERMANRVPLMAIILRLK